MDYATMTTEALQAALRRELNARAGRYADGRRRAVTDERRAEAARRLWEIYAELQARR